MSVKKIDFVKFANAVIVRSDTITSATSEQYDIEMHDNVWVEVRSKRDPSRQGTTSIYNVICLRWAPQPAAPELKAAPAVAKPGVPKL